ncbi:MAG: glycosyltransferase [Clostridiales bacterium]|nr:glycosyltransferase [Clostridiales bacterium]
MRVTLQTVLFSDEACDMQELFFRKSGRVKIISADGDRVSDKEISTDAGLSGNPGVRTRIDAGVSLAPGAGIRTDTYMNLFDTETWRKYTGTHEWKLVTEICGKGRFRLCKLEHDREYRVVTEDVLNCRDFETREYKLADISGMCYFELSADEEMEIRQAAYIADVPDDCINPVRLSLVICTYQRNRQVLRNMDKVRGSRFFDPESEWYHCLRLRVVDNASELTQIEEPYIRLYHNPNTGGSGGFIRGIQETVDALPEEGSTHVLLMDDDVEFIPETLYRLCALCRLFRPEYRDEVVAGRMFRLDRRCIQHTAAEIWNGGDLIHAGGNLDMTKRENLPAMNRAAGEYTGWWFGCFPMSFVKDNLPLPFFLHCDDVEYGLRHGGQPVVLNGIQVWHETYEYRESMLLAYYDAKNSMIVNAMYGEGWSADDVLKRWKMRVRGYFGERKFRLAWAAECALFDFLKGREYFLSHTEKKNFSPQNGIGFPPVVLMMYVAGLVRCRLRGKRAVYDYDGIGRNDDGTECAFMCTEKCTSPQN